MKQGPGFLARVLQNTSVTRSHVLDINQRRQHELMTTASWWKRVVLLLEFGVHSVESFWKGIEVVGLVSESSHRSTGVYREGWTLYQACSP